MGVFQQCYNNRRGDDSEDDSEDESEFELLEHFQDFKEIIKNWKALYFKKLDDHIKDKFVLVLMKMYKFYPKNPLESIVDLKNAGKCRNL